MLCSVQGKGFALTSVSMLLLLCAYCPLQDKRVDSKNILTRSALVSSINSMNLLAMVPQEVRGRGACVVDSSSRLQIRSDSRAGDFVQAAERSGQLLLLPWCCTPYWGPFTLVSPHA
jgi:hypothetical protein